MYLLFGLSIFGIIIHFFLFLAPKKNLYGISLVDIPLLLVIIIAGIPLSLQIIKKLIKKDFGADFLAVMAVITAVFLSEYLAATIIISMLSSGQVLESYAVRKASFALLALSERMPLLAHAKKDGLVKDIEVKDIQIGDEILVYPHEICPVDGQVLEGYGSMDESYLTGEPYLVSKAPGVMVISGAKNSNSLLLIKALKIPKESRYAKIMEVMEDAEQKRPKMRRLADQMGAIFAPLALLFAFVVWFLSRDPERFLAVLVIATPCPLLIAIPVTIISAISLASKKGIIIKDPLILERLPTCRTAIFDKTGTLTYGKAELYEIQIISPSISEEEILKLAGSIEQYSKHPLAQAVQKAIEIRGLDLPIVSHVSEIPGKGIYGEVLNKKIQITDRKAFLSLYNDKQNVLPTIKQGLECLVLMDDELLAIFHFRDTLRYEGTPFISHLAPMHNFKKVMIVSGDRLSEVQYLAEKLGITEALANQTPEQKVFIVKEESKKAPTLFVGDGINDAPALAVATSGIAFGHHNKITTEAGGAVILDSSLAKVDELIHISESMRRVALQSAIGGMAFAMIGMFLAAFGFISPVVGALIQEAIDVLAIINALKLTWWSNMPVHIKSND